MKVVGKVLNIDKNKVYLVTKDNKFVTVKKNHIKPEVGKLYSGDIIEKPSSKKIMTISIVAVCILLISIYASTFFITYSTVIVDLNCTIKIDLNKKQQIIKTSSKDKLSFQLTDSLNIDGNSINDGLIMLFDEALKKKILTIPNGYQLGTVSIYIPKNKNKETINLNKFIDYAFNKRFKVLLNNNKNEFQ